MKFDDLTREQLLKIVKNYSKYGIIYERPSDNPNFEEEQVVIDCKNNIPILERKPELDIKNGKNNHLLIEADNYHALLALKMVYQGKVDVIYIDPPYNRGKNNFKYNDKFIEKGNQYYHSKWLDFMEKRLSLAKSLLSERGVLFISIDDNEHAQLKMLCDQILDLKFITSIPRLASSQRSGQEKYMNVSHDYILCYSKTDDFEKNIERSIDYSKLEKDHIGSYYKGDTKAILASLTQGYSKGGDYDFEFNGKIYQPVTKEGVRNRWLWTKDRMEAAAKLGILVETSNTLRMQVYIDKSFEVKTNIMVDKKKGLIFHTADFMKDEIYTNPTGTKQLEKILNAKKMFDNPKPVGLIKKLLQFVDKDDCKVVMDFFAGSGTTGEAVLELNSEDGGNRQFILITNNENEIMEKVCYPRIKTVLTGRRNDNSKYSNGFSDNVFYYKSSFVRKSKLDHETSKYYLLDKINDLLCIKEDTYEQYETASNYFFAFGNENLNKLTIIYIDIYDDEKLINVCDFMNDNKFDNYEKTVYVFSRDNNVDYDTKEILSINANADKILPIPSNFYKIYRKTIEDYERKH